MKTKEELNALKEEVKSLHEKLSVLTEDELAQVTGGYHVPIHIESFTDESRLEPPEGGWAGTIE